MKKILYIFIAVISFFMFDNVKAANLIECEYTVNFYNVTYSAPNKTTTFTISIDQNKNVVLPPDFGSETLGTNNFIWYGEFENIFLNTSTVSANEYKCPTLYAFFENNDINIGVGDSYTKEEAKEIVGKVKSISSNIQTPTIREICTRERPLRNQPYKINITFYYQGDLKRWKITTSNGDALGNASADLAISVGTGAIMMRSDVKEKMFKDKATCESTPLYLQTPTNNNDMVYLQLEKPLDEENGSLNVNDAVYDDGGIHPDTEITEPDRDYATGCAMLGDGVIALINKIYGYFTWIIPVLIVILSIVDFIKVVGTGDDKDFKHAQSNLMKRIIIGIVFFLVPVVVKLFINISGITNNFTNGDGIIETITCVLK